MRLSVGNNRLPTRFSRRLGTGKKKGSLLEQSRKEKEGGMETSLLIPCPWGEKPVKKKKGSIITSSAIQKEVGGRAPLIEKKKSLSFGRDKKEGSTREEALFLPAGGRCHSGEGCTACSGTGNLLRLFTRKRRCRGFQGVSPLPSPRKGEGSIRRFLSRARGGERRLLLSGKRRYARCREQEGGKKGGDPSSLPRL